MMKRIKQNLFCPAFKLTNKLVLFILFTLLLFNHNFLPGRENAFKNILVICSWHKMLPGQVLLEQGLYSGFESYSPEKLRFFVEYSDYYVNSSDPQLLADILSIKYQGKKIDLVIAIGDTALITILACRKAHFPGTPVIFSTVAKEEIESAELPPDISGILVDLDIRGTLDTALKIHAHTRRVVFISGLHPTDEAFKKKSLLLVPDYEKRVEIIYLTGLSMKDLLKEVANLPEHTIVFYLLYQLDEEGITYFPWESLSLIAGKANAPVYGLLDTFIGRGIVGGKMIDLKDTGFKTAQLTRRVLQGEKPGVIIDTGNYIFDWRQLKRWKIKEKNLPPGSTIRFKQETTWERYHWYIIGAIALLLIQGFLIAGLLTQKRKHSRAQNKLKSILENIPDLVWMKDAHSRYTAVNKAFLDAVGKKAEDIINFTSEVLYGEEKAKKFRAEDLEVMTGKKQEFITEKRIFIPDETVWLEIIKSPIFDRLGKVIGTVGIARNITERKKNELDRQRLHEELLHVSKLLTMGELTASIAHELNQPLTAIRSNAQAGLRTLKQLKPDVPAMKMITEILDDIVADNKRASEVIIKLRRLLKKEEAIEFTPVDLNLAVREVIDITHSDMVIKDIIVETHLDPHLPAVMGDKIQLQQVILNLVVNAADAINHANADTRKITIQTGKLDEQNIKVSVKDSGPGIDAEQITRIFDPFYTSKTDGLGIGLSIVKSIIEAHGGTVGAENNRDRGAAVWFTLPVNPG